MGHSRGDQRGRRPGVPRPRVRARRRLSALQHDRVRRVGSAARRARRAQAAASRASICPVGCGRHVGVRPAHEPARVRARAIAGASRCRRFTPERFAATLDAIGGEASRFLVGPACASDDVQLRYALDMRYEGQGYEVEVPLPRGARAGGASTPRCPSCSQRVTARSSGWRSTSARIEIVNWKVEAHGPRPGAGVTLPAASTSARSAETRVKGHRPAYFPERRRHGRMPGVRPLRIAAGHDDRGSRADRGARVDLRARPRRSRHRWTPRSTSSSTCGGAAMSATTRIALGIQWDRLISIADEIVNSLVRTSFSTNVRESYDLSCVVFDAQGPRARPGLVQRAVVHRHAPRHAGHMLARFPAETLQARRRDGHQRSVDRHRATCSTSTSCSRCSATDASSATSLSITHLPDIGGARLLGHRARGLRGRLAHARSSSCCTKGKPDALLFELIRTNVRVPEQTIGDIMANVSCTTVGGRMLNEFMTEYGVDRPRAAGRRHHRSVGARHARRDRAACRRACIATRRGRRSRRAAALRVRGDHRRRRGHGRLHRHRALRWTSPSTCRSATRAR